MINVLDKKERKNKNLYQLLPVNSFIKSDEDVKDFLSVSLSCSGKLYVNYFCFFPVFISLEDVPIIYL